MTRLGSLIVSAGMCMLLACANNQAATDPIDLVPIDNTVPGWTVDQAHNKSPGERAMTATTATGAGGLIDGGFENYYQEPYIPKMFLWQNYVNSTMPAAPEGATVKLYIFEMESADKAKGIYTAILQRPAYQEVEWGPSTPTVGTESRLQNTSSQWWVNFHQGVFYAEVLLGPSFGPPPTYALDDPDTKAEAVRFAQAVASKI